MSSIPRLEALIPVYISDRTLYPIIEQCFTSLKDYYPDIPIRVLDDGSPLPFADNWLEMVDVYIHHNKNEGYTKAVNALLDSSDAEVRIICNDDLIFHEGCLDQFYGLKGLMIGSPSDTAASPDDRFGSIWGITREAYELLGPLNDNYVHFFSDLDYYERAKAKGVRIEKWSDVIEHHESATYKTVDKESLYEKDLLTYERLSHQYK